MSLADVWAAFQAAHSALPPAVPDRFDNPFLVNYVAYHHYRALGWVVKGGIKFCVDLLLYKRGPVFSHAECVLLPPPACPAVADRAPQVRDRRDPGVRGPRRRGGVAARPPEPGAVCVVVAQHAQPRQLAGPQGTDHRVLAPPVGRSCASQTLILSYVTIPSSSRCKVSPASPACLQHYTIREVVVRRFIPARMRE
jgi:tRNA-splicing endonuclease subunit Sen2